MPNPSMWSGPWGALTFVEGMQVSRPGSLSSTFVDDRDPRGYRGVVDIEASARKHGVPDEDMLHAIRHHWRAFETDDPAVTMFIGPSRAADPLEVGVVSDEGGTAVIHAMRARRKFLEGWWIE
jgi:hypothetical protein